MTELYWATSSGHQPRDTGSRQDYVLFIDLGSYRTSVVCWPRKQSTPMKEASRYVVWYEHDFGREPGFPAAFIRPLGKDASQFRFVRNVESDEWPEEQIVKSAKYEFAKSFAHCKGQVPDFKVYIKEVLRKSLEYVTAPDLKRAWNHPGVPKISEIRVTVPDLFVENLRMGYRLSILDACKELVEEDGGRWKLIFPESLQKSDESFVKISSDESGASELYFLNLLREMAFWNLSRQFTPGSDLSRVKRLFANVCPANSSDDSPSSSLNFVICHLDIGGLTTAASVVLLSLYQHERTKVILGTLLEKHTFAQNAAGEHLKRAYRESIYSQNQTPGKEIPWWDSKEFVQSVFASFIKPLVERQAKLVTQWKCRRSSEECKPLHGLYYIVSGRPSRARYVQEAITETVLKIFNRSELSFLADHVIFMSNYYHIGTTGTEFYAERIPDFEKLITTLGNTLTLHPFYKIDTKVTRVRYLITLKLSDDPKLWLRLSSDSNSRDVEGTSSEEFRLANELHHDSVKFWLSKTYDDQAPTEPNWIPLLEAKRVVNEIESPKFTIPSANIDPSAWIVPSIEITNLEDNSEAFELIWTFDDPASVTSRSASI